MHMVSTKESETLHVFAVMHTACMQKCISTGTTGLLFSTDGSSCLVLVKTLRNRNSWVPVETPGSIHLPIHNCMSPLVDGMHLGVTAPYTFP